MFKCLLVYNVIIYHFIHADWQNRFFVIICSCLYKYSYIYFFIFQDFFYVYLFSLIICSLWQTSCILQQDIDLCQFIEFIFFQDIIVLCCFRDVLSCFMYCFFVYLQSSCLIMQDCLFWLSRYLRSSPLFQYNCDSLSLGFTQLTIFYYFVSHFYIKVLFLLFFFYIYCRFFYIVQHFLYCFFIFVFVDSLPWSQCYKDIFII